MTSSGLFVEGSRKLDDDLTDPGDIRAAVEQRLASLIDLQASVPGNLHAALRHALLGHSKRVRPVMMFMIAEPRNAQIGPVLDVGCAVEMVHTASLILDDLPCMDDATLRRQRPTTHIAFGQPTAILSAIALLTRAFGIIAALEDVPATTRTRLAAVLSDAVGWDGLVAGQEIDINNRASLQDAEQVENLNWLKTGVLFVAAAEMGAILRGLEAERLEAVRRFARHFGLAFQTADDLLDRTDTAEQAGKDVGKDGDKATLVSLFGASHARMTCQQHLAHAEQALADSGVSAAPVRALMMRLFDARQPGSPQ
ncbi:polyprenyl synthetase family protein [Devosia sp. SL43]|uniref:polyprenyl synthetase family protein n=1 Tax=Devosia sp. SL43 TaxID=2806348 RepID=UPI001F16A2EB|nr:polyprenyl synthetase family protein [Devosia sp. SL43]UJW84630.1 polyprenyl synthetase family protein [Devosia sp. SL43]